MDIELLKTFVKIMALGSITKAADDLSMTQSAISKRMDRLEKQIGYPLFTYLSKQILPNEHAYKLLPHAEMMLMLHQNFVETLYVEFNQPMMIHIGTTLFTTMCYLSPIIKLVEQSDYPFLCDYKQIKDEDIDYNLNTATLDVIIGVDTSTKHDQIKKIPLMNESFHCIVNKDHPLATRDKINLKELFQYPALLTEKGYPIRDNLDKISQPLKLEPNIKVLSSSFLVLQQLVRDGVGWTILPETLCPDDLKRIHVEPLFKTIPICLYVHEKRLESGYIQQLINLLQTYRPNHS